MARGWGRLKAGREATVARAALLAACACWPICAHAQSVEDLQGLSISELANLQVSSATKTPESLSDAPAALYVITRDEIARSGAVTLPQMLRLAPNLFIAQTSSHGYVITARGLNGNTQAQSFANKLLVLIDGRTVYNPLFSGVDWDALDVVPADIDRIEVISGPGATLWGANAVNGVINIITRRSYETQGALIDASAGSMTSSATVRGGVRLSDDLTLRLYSRLVAGDDTVTATGASAHDHWRKAQAGFAMNWTPSAADAISLSGDAYAGEDAQPTPAQANLSGYNLNLHWNHASANGSLLQVQAYFNREERGPDSTGGTPYWYDSYDLDVQHDFSLGDRQAVVLGGGVRATRYNISRTANFFYSVPSGTLLLADVFGQDTISLTRSLDLIVGLKFEDDPYSGVSTLPSARLTWRASPGLLVWASAQKAIRSPTPFDEAPEEFLGATLFLTGNTHFLPEKLATYEVGVRAQPSPIVSFSASAFYNDYDDLRSIEFSSTGFPLMWGNSLRGRGYGLEAWGDIQAAPWWRLSAGLDLFSKRLTFKSGASGLLGVAQAGDDPPTQASLRSAMNLGHNVTLDAELRYVATLPNPRVPGYAEMNLNLAWNLTPHLQLDIAGFNLLHDHHLEFMSPATEVPRSGQAELRLRF
jgi:iron complex outermembrane receptor protein